MDSETTASGRKCDVISFMRIMYCLLQRVIIVIALHKYNNTYKPSPT